MPAPTSSELQASLAVGGAGLLWASAGLIGQYSGCSALVLAELRLAGAALALGAVLGPSRLREALGAQPAGVMLAAMAGMAAFQWSFFAAVAQAGAASATWTSVASGPLWAAALSRLSGVRAGDADRSAAGMVVLGLLLMLWGQPVPLPGLGFSLLSGLAYALYVVAAGRAAAVSAASGSLSITTLALAGGACALLPLCGAALPAELQHHAWRSRELASLAFLALGSTALAYWLFARGLSRLTAHKALALQWVQPVATELLAASAPGHHLDLWSLSGMCLITFVLLGGHPSRPLSLSRQTQS